MPETCNINDAMKYYKNWNVYLATTHYNFEYNGHKVYNATNCWYIVKDNTVHYDIFGYYIWGYLQSIAGGTISDIRNMFDTHKEFESYLKENKLVIL
jgi:hypothetical protein